MELCKGEASTYDFGVILPSPLPFCTVVVHTWKSFQLVLRKVKRSVSVKQQVSGRNKYPSLSLSVLSGTRIVYERNFLMQMRHSPLAKSPPANLPNIPGVTVGSPICNGGTNAENGGSGSSGSEAKTKGSMSPSANTSAPRRGSVTCGEVSKDDISVTFHTQIHVILYKMCSNLVSCFSKLKIKLLRPPQRPSRRRRTTSSPWTCERGDEMGEAKQRQKNHQKNQQKTTRE